MKLSISIMAHPSRIRNITYLQDKIGNCGIPVSLDDGIGIWKNCKQAWRLKDKNSEWHLVVQDDAIICKDFQKLALEVIEQAELKKCEAISLFFGNRLMMDQAKKDGDKNGYWISGWMHWGIAICMKTKHIEPMLKFGDKMNIPQDDARIANYIRENKIKVYYPIPCLIDHEIGKSLVGDRGKNRVAYKFIDKQNENK